MTLLLNGCSYGQSWHSFPGQNLSRAGGSFYRSIRTTLEWIAVNGKPSYVFIPITFCARFEISKISVDKPIEGAYDLTPFSHYKIESQLSDSCYRSWDYLFMNIIMFSSWLEQQGIKYLMWDQCNDFDPGHITGFKAFEKLKWIENNPRIIPLFEFCGNQYMYDMGGKWNNTDSNEIPAIRHYLDEAYPILKDYLDRYAKEQLNETIDWN